MRSQSVLTQVEKFVTKFYENEIPKVLRFHNLKHVKNVVQAVKILCLEEKVAEKDKELLLIAAWLHDIGMVDTYRGHEEASKIIAADFLSKLNYPKEKINAVLNLIDCTKVPHQPKNKLEFILCDADLFHLAQREYFNWLEDLRSEWENILQKKYEESIWCQENLRFLNNHHYFTAYGKTVLQPRKWINIQKLSTWKGCLEQIGEGQLEFNIPE